MRWCEECIREKDAILSDGRRVCTWCPSWRVECEARYLLAMPLAERNDALAAREQRRGNIDTLKDAMARIHAQKRTKSTVRTSKRR